ncbi:hypothetical protein FC21_GL000243 [Limosilactobacillus equigenerosi DSM 18793 = JCM 14505]|uniref:DUF1433 domain-containing protein n=1 Tax=Limosilactobacillus equigenerosi DSM 18793 = JCM 14505 TaxID=1423742 RepID=A0A0R1URK6_9LACO|nr:hypothetical protein FC21_GL000243 [Limosilactobacillus equigenerosi DSM 18793 = JCM 14505]
MSILIGLVVIWGVSGIFITKRHVGQQAVQEAKEERRVQQKCAEYLVHHYEGIKTLEVSKLYKPNEVGGGGYYVGIRVNNSDSLIFVGSDTEEKFKNDGPSLDGYDPDFLKSSINEKYNNSRNLKNIVVNYTDKTINELRKK